ncbi:MAG TPA: HEAT repeat domain-containing protein [Phycisphaerae bacterium]|nr:HEAT repeat domain-containing protein [Phycisphaerae bacterium]
MGMVTPFRARLVLGLGLLTAAACSVCLGHGEGPQPPPGPPTSFYLTNERIYPARWSWIHWWEANRDPYLKTIVQGLARQQVSPEVLKAYRDKAVRALVAATTSRDTETRAAAVLALGRMGEKGAFQALQTAAGKDPELGVRMPALVAYGLLDTPEARDLLLAHDYPNDTLFEAGCSGLGLLRDADDPKVLSALQKGVGGGGPGLASISAWGLRHRPTPANIQFLQTILLRSKSPWLASEAILALGDYGDPKAVPLLADILLATKQADGVAAWEALRTHDTQVAALFEKKGKLKNDELEKYRREYKKHSDWREYGPNPPGPKPDGPTMSIKVGIEKVYLARLRASAAMALGKIRHPRSQEALLAALALRDDNYSDLFKGFAIMSLGRMGNPDILPPLLGYLATRYPEGKPKTLVEIDSPLRGYAALALGLYCRPTQTDQGQADPPMYAKVCAKLADRVADRDETLEVRAAAAMGLGLTGRTECLRLIHPAKKSATANDDLLVGYILLASAMVGDQNILKPARWFLTEVKDKETTDGILGRRAAVLALGMLNTPQTIPILTEAWHLNYHVNREVAVAFALSEAYNVTDPLVALLTTSKNPLEQAFAAQCLGELFNRERPQRLAWFINDCNYSVKNKRMMPYQALANEFLYAYLIPCFGDQWQ